MADSVKPDYVLVLEQTIWGKLLILLHNNGRELDLTREWGEFDNGFYQLVGKSHSGYPALDLSAAKIIIANPKMQIHMRGQSENLADVVDGLYPQRFSLLEEFENEAGQTPNERFVLRHRFPLAGIAYSAVALPFGAAAISTYYYDLPPIPWFVAAGILTAVALVGTAYLCIVGSKDDARTEAMLQLGAKGTEFLKNLDSFRESLLRAGVAKGMFPPEYGLR